MIRKLFILIIIWLIFIALEYFLLPYFVKPLTWFLFCLTLFILSIGQIIKILKERKNLKLERILNLSIILILFLLTFYNFNKIPTSIMEKIDWKISYNKRNQIIKEVENGQLQPNTAMNNGICKLPFKFPFVSNGGNDICIYNKKNSHSKTIKFWISRGFFDSPQTYFIYTSDEESIKHYQDLIKNEPEHNWRIEENWFRIMERY
jgi:hypothetical protein